MIPNCFQTAFGRWVPEPLLGVGTGTNFVYAHFLERSSKEEICTGTDPQKIICVHIYILLSPFLFRSVPVPPPKCKTMKNVFGYLDLNYLASLVGL